MTTKDRNSACNNGWCYHYYYYYVLSASLLLLITATASAADLRLDGGPELGWDTSAWRAQVDGVMGGQSSGFLEFGGANDSVLDFSGDIVLNGGGFSSIRRTFQDPVDLSSHAGIVIELETSEWHTFISSADDTNNNNIQAPLGMHLQLHDQTSRWGYASAFAVPLSNVTGSTTRVFLPLASFTRASRSGWQCRTDDCSLDPTTINEMDLYVLFQEGPFHVLVKSITAVANATSFASPMLPMTSFRHVTSLVQSTIRSGGKLYDYDYPELCIAIYRSTLNTLLASTGGGMTDAIKALVCDGLQRAAEFRTTEDLVDIAWSLRGTLDQVLEYDGDNSDPILVSTNQDGSEDSCVAVTSFPPVLTSIMMLDNTNNTTENSNSTILLVPAGSTPRQGTVRGDTRQVVDLRNMEASSAPSQPHNPCGLVALLGVLSSLPITIL